MAMKCFVFCLLLFVACNCARKESITSDLLPDRNNCGSYYRDTLIGGVLPTLGEFPWMALIEYEKPKSRGFHCGGALINNRYVLTAAHCLKGKDLPATWKLKNVRLGEYDTTTETDCYSDGPGLEDCADLSIDVPIEEEIAHEGYDPHNKDQQHDIALLRLAREVKYTNYIKPICVPTAADLLNDDFVGKSTIAAGWENFKSNVLLKLNVKVKSNSDCSSVYAGKVTLGAGQLCAGGVKRNDTCRSDSGGPLIVLDQNPEEANYFVIGVTSFGTQPCGLEGWPDVFARVTEYVPWIVSKLKP